jgi:hypothetical protein
MLKGLKGAVKLTNLVLCHILVEIQGFLGLTLTCNFKHKFS